MKQKSHSYQEKRRNSLLKAISWRCIATLTTMGISYFVTGNTKVAISIAVIEFILKILLYYVHERTWIFLLHNAQIEKLKGY